MKAESVLGASANMSELLLLAEAGHFVCCKRLAKVGEVLLRLIADVSEVSIASGCGCEWDVCCNKKHAWEVGNQGSNVLPEVRLG